MATATQAEIDALYNALRTGALIVKHGDTSVTYRSRAEIKATIAEMEREVNGVPRRVVAKFTTGL